MLFLSQRSMETEPQKESSKLIGKEYENGERKKESIEKIVKNKKLKGSKRMRIEGARRKPFNEKLDAFVLESIHERRSKSLRVSRKLMKKAIIMYDDIVKESESNLEQALAG